MDDAITYISDFKLASKSYSYSFEWSEEDLDKDKSGSSEKTQSLGDGSSGLIGDLSKKGTDIFILINQKMNIYHICEKNYLTLTLKA